MKISDFVMCYPTNLRHDGICRIRIFMKNNKGYVLITDIKGNPSTSAEYCLEDIVEKLQAEGYLSIDAEFILQNENGLHVGYQWLGTELRDFFQWKTMRTAQVAQLLGCEEEELTRPSQETPAVHANIQKTINRVDPFYGFPWPVEPTVAKRRIEIADGRIPKSELQQLVNARAGERELQALLKKDLSLLGEYLAYPSEEYICFAEYPMGDGRVDFVVLTGRSRMDVILVEIKGADVPLYTKTGEIKLANSGDTALAQLEARHRHIYNNYEAFRKQIHQNRMNAENGGGIYNAFLGPRWQLQVDPNKDVDVRYLLVCGYTRDDLEESKRRHIKETSIGARYSIESWDTFLRKLDRA